MSTRDDARLTARERAALSSLEALATADDPQLAARLRGPSPWNLALYRARLQLLISWAHVPVWLHSLWVAIPAVAVGLGLAVVGLSVGWAVGVLGALLSTAGLTSIVRDAGRRFGSRPGG
jgi:hypothetical protein